MRLTFDIISLVLAFFVMFTVYRVRKARAIDDTQTERTWKNIETAGLVLLAISLVVQFFEG